MTGQPAANLYIELRALVSKFTSDMDSATSKITGFESKVTKTFENIKRVGQAALAIGGVIAVKKLSDALLELAASGDAAQDIVDNFQKLGGASASIEEARKAVLGTVSAFDLMQAANQGLIRGIPQFNEQFGKMADFAKRYAEANGKDTVAVLNEFTAALAKGKSKGLEPFGFQLDKNLTKLQVQEEAMRQLNTVTEQLAKPTDSVAEAQEALAVSWDDALKKIGMGVNANADLTVSYRLLQKAIDDIDFVTLGQNLSTISGIFVTLGTTVIPTVAGAVDGLVMAFEELTNSGVRGKLLNIGDEIDQARKDIKSLEEGWSVGSLIDQANGGRLASQIRGTLSGLERKRDELLTDYNKQYGTGKGSASADAQIEIEKKIAAERKKIEDEIAEHRKRVAGEAAAKELAAEAKKMEAMRDKWEKAIGKNDEKSIESQLKAAVDSVNQTEFDGLITKLKGAVEEGFVKEWQEAIDKGVVSEADVRKEAQNIAEQHADSYRKEMTDAVKDVSDKMNQSYAQAFDGMLGSMDQIGSELGVDLGGLAQTLGQALSDETKAGIMEGLGEVFGMSGEGAASALQSYFGAATTVLSAAMSAKQTDKENNDNSGTGSAVGAGGGAIIGGAFFGPAGAEIGAQIGQIAGTVIGGMIKHGPQNAETLARHQIAGYLEDEIRKLSTIAFYNNGKLQTQDAKSFNIQETTGAFSKPGWAEDMNAWGDKAKGTFGALGEALKEINGITEDVGSQIAYMLGTQLGGSVDNARLLVQQLGFDLTKMQDALFQAARKGSSSWQEYSIQMAGLDEAFKPGLEKVAALGEAWDSFVQSGGRGVAALKAGKDIGQEAIEAGAKTFDEARKKLVEMGKDPEQVATFFDALKARGIDTFKELAEAQEQVLGAAIGDAGNNSKALSALWEEATASIDKYTEAINSIPEERETHITATTTMDDDTRLLLQNSSDYNASTSVQSNSKTQKFARGGVVHGSTLFQHAGGVGNVGENPGHSEAIFPLTKVGGKLSIIGESGGGRGSGNTIYMDLRGAQQGVGAEVERVMHQFAPMIVQQAVDASFEVAQRHMGA